MSTAIADRAPSPLRELRRVIAGQGVSSVGSCLTAVAVPWLVLSLTGSGFALGVCVALAGLPKFILMLPAGAVVDRLTPRRVAVAANCALGLVMAWLGLLAVTGQVTIGATYVAGLLVGVSSAFLMPAQMALVTQVTPRESNLLLLRANALWQGSIWAAQLASAVMAGTVLSVVPHHSPIRGCGLVFLLDAATYAVCMGLSRLTSPASASACTAGVLESMRDGLSFIRRERGLLHAFLGSACFSAAIIGLLQVNIPIQVQQLSGGGSARALGIMSAAFGIGGLLGAAATNRYKPVPERILRLQYGAIVVEGVLFAAASMAGQLWQLAAFELTVGALGAFSSVSFGAMVQRVTPDAVRARVGAVMMLITMTPTALLSPAIGDFARGHTQLVYVLAAGVMLAGGLIVPRSRHIRALPFRAAA